jgi:hypothetical protein
MITRRKKMNKWKRGALALAILLLITLSFVYFTLGEPSGATLTSNSTDNGPTINPLALTNNRSTITTIVLDSLQQDQRWKGYVGNVTGTLTLDDSNNFTIYDWTGVNTAAGEVYASRNSSLTFSSVSCVDNATLTAEQTALNMTGTEADSINRTFNGTDHTTTSVGATPLSNCRMISTYVNDADQGQDSGDSFQEFLMEDSTNNLIYVAIMNDNTAGYNNNNYDFQMIVAESSVQATPQTYYFWVELDG